MSGANPLGFAVNCTEGGGTPVDVPSHVPPESVEGATDTVKPGPPPPLLIASVRGKGAAPPCSATKIMPLGDRSTRAGEGHPPAVPAAATPLVGKGMLKPCVLGKEMAQFRLPSPPFTSCNTCSG